MEVPPTWSLDQMNVFAPESDLTPDMLLAWDWVPAGM
jgi:hypothetical protein